MPESYFKNFNIIQYGNSTSNVAVVDITERVVTLNNVEKNPNVYYPLDIVDGTRADTITNNVYGDPYTSWSLYLSNDIIDPYYEWYLTQDQFLSFIVNKYGSLQNATQKVAYYINNWVEQNALSISGYNALAPELKKYWTPTFGSHSQIINYVRIREDWKSSTNKIYTFNISGNSNFTVDEIVNINYTYADANTNNGKAQVMASNSSTVIVQHTFNNVFPSNNSFTAASYVYGTESNSNVLINSVQSTSNNISDTELSYWSAVYYYDMESEKNEGNKSILVLQPNLLPSYISNVKKLLSQ